MTDIALPPGAVVRAPGRVNLIGEHTDYTGGLVLPAAINLGMWLTVESVGGSRIRLSSAHAPEPVDVAADGSDPPASGWGRYVAAVAAALQAHGRPPIGLTGRIDSDLPQGCGLSSSAALEVAVATALCGAAGFTRDPMELATICQAAEHDAVGVPSGVMDQAASLLGRAGHALLLDCRTLQHRQVPLPDDHILLVVDSGVRRQLETSAYGDRVRQLAEATARLDGRTPAEISPEELPDLADLDTIAGRRLRHVVTENARVRATVAAFETGDLATLDRCFAESHASLRDDFEVSIPELDGLVALARNAGATAARMTGGGFGGAIVALVPAAGVAQVAAKVVAGARARWPGRAVVAHACHAVDGAGVLEPDSVSRGQTADPGQP